MKIHNQHNPSFGMKYPIIKTKNVSSDFVSKVEQGLKSLPDEWEHSLKRNNYKLYCSNSIQDTFEHLSIPEQAPDWDAATSAHPWFPFFVFTTKIGKEDLQRVINHEISHGIVNSEKLVNNWNYLGAIYKDAEKFAVENPDYTNPHNIRNLLLLPIDDYRINEVFADIIAWAQKGGGLWGSGYKNGEINPNFFKENYPNTFEKLNKFKISIKEEPEYYNNFDDFDAPF